MKPCLQVAFWCGALLLALAPAVGFAQTVPATTSAAVTYDFLTVTTTESGNNKAESKILIAPPLLGKSEVQLQEFNSIYSKKDRERLQLNALSITQQLTEITAAGWELFQVYPLNLNPTLVATRYLFRKARR